MNLKGNGVSPMFPRHIFPHFLWVGLRLGLGLALTIENVGTFGHGSIGLWEHRNAPEKRAPGPEQRTFVIIPIRTSRGPTNLSPG